MAEAYSQSIRGVDEVFRRLSFGCNGGKHPNSSTAVSVGLILNYLDRTVDNRILPDALKAEELKGFTWDEGRYPHTALLHNHLLRRCHLAPGILGRWGRGVVERFRRTWQARPWTRGVIVRCGFGGFGKRRSWRLVTQEIDASRPVMITVPRKGSKTLQGRWHTMVVCGYRVTVFGRKELLVHTGRYGASIKGSRAKLSYISLSRVICSYRFDVVLLNAAR